MFSTVSITCKDLVPFRIRSLQPGPLPLPVQDALVLSTERLGGRNNSNLGTNACVLAEIFRVSPGAMRFRLVELGFQQTPQAPSLTRRGPF
jgi:hypothetical protein